MQHEVKDKNSGREATLCCASGSPTCHRRMSGPLPCVAGKSRVFRTHSTRGIVQVLMGTCSAPGTLSQGPSNVLGQVRKDSAAVLVVVAEVRGDSRNHRILRWGQSDDSVLKILHSIHQFFKVFRVEVIRKWR